MTNIITIPDVNTYIMCIADDALILTRNTDYMSNIITIPNIINYNMVSENNILVLTRNSVYISETDLFNKDLRCSKLTYSCLCDNKLPIGSYNTLLVKVYSQITKENILQHATMNVSPDKLCDKGFHYYEELGVSIQGADASRTLKEIINMAKKFQLALELKIQLNSGEIVQFMV